MAWTEPVGNGKHYGCFRNARGDQDKVRDKSERPIQYSSKAVANREACDAENKARDPNEIPRDAGKITWAEWREEWWPKRKIEANTDKNQESARRTHIDPYWDTTPLDEIEQEGVQEWVDQLPGKPGSVKEIYYRFQSGMTAAVKAKKIRTSPCVGIELPTSHAPDIHFLERAEFDQLLAFLVDPWRMLALIAVGTGMRWGEVVSLHWQDVHFGPGTITIRHAYSRAGLYIKPFPKSRKPRVVPMSKKLAGQLRRWHETLAPADRCRETHKEGSCRSGLVLPDADGGALPYQSCKDKFNAAVKLSKIGHTTMHDLRDTYASWLLQDGVSLEQLAELLGHRNFNLTRERYAQFGSTKFDNIRSVLDQSAPVVPQAADSNVIDFAVRRRSNLRTGGSA